MFNTSKNYEARAYNLQGLKYTDRRKRTRNLDRCKANCSCEQILEQGGKTWVVSRRGSKNEKEVQFSSSSSHVSNKEMSMVPSCNKAQSPGSSFKVHKSEVFERPNQPEERISDHTLETFRNSTQESTDAHRAMRRSRLESQADSVHINLDGSAALSDADKPKVAESCATSSLLRPANGQRTSIPALSDRKERADGSTSGSRTRKSPEQLERRRRRQQVKRQVKSMMKSNLQDREPTPRVENSEVRRLLYKQEFTLKSAHQA